MIRNNLLTKIGVVMKEKKRKSNEFICAKCGELCIGTTSEEKKLKEKEEMFGDIPLEDCVSICDDCFQAIFN